MGSIIYPGFSACLVLAVFLSHLPAGFVLDDGLCHAVRNAWCWPGRRCGKYDSLENDKAARTSTKLLGGDCVPHLLGRLLYQNVRRRLKRRLLHTSRTESSGSHAASHASQSTDVDATVRQSYPSSTADVTSYVEVTYADVNSTINKEDGVVDHMEPVRAGSAVDGLGNDKALNENDEAATIALALSAPENWTQIDYNLTRHTGFVLLRDNMSQQEGSMSQLDGHHEWPAEVNAEQQTAASLDTDNAETTHDVHAPWKVDLHSVVSTDETPKSSSHSDNINEQPHIEPAVSLSVDDKVHHENVSETAQNDSNDSLSQTAGPPNIGTTLDESSQYAHVNTLFRYSRVDIVKTQVKFPPDNVNRINRTLIEAGNSTNMEGRNVVLGSSHSSNKTSDFSGVDSERCAWQGGCPSNDCMNVIVSEEQMTISTILLINKHGALVGNASSQWIQLETRHNLSVYAAFTLNMTMLLATGQLCAALCSFVQNDCPRVLTLNETILLVSRSSVLSGLQLAAANDSEFRHIEQAQLASEVELVMDEMMAHSEQSQSRRDCLEAELCPGHNDSTMSAHCAALISVVCQASAQKSGEISETHVATLIALSISVTLLMLSVVANRRYSSRVAVLERVQEVHVQQQHKRSDSQAEPPPH